jgi:RimJ/RimL family protein N-acetyltransferase
MADEVSFVEGSAVEATGIITLIRQLETETTSIEFDAAIHEASLEQVGQNLDLIQQSPTNFLLIAKLGTTPIGIVTLVETDEEHHRAELGVGVLQAYWHNGIGTALVDEAVYWASNFSWLSELWLDVLADNQYAIRLYQNLGFQTKTPSIKDDQGRSLIKMVLPLS